MRKDFTFNSSDIRYKNTTTDNSNDNNNNHKKKKHKILDGVHNRHSTQVDNVL